MRKNPLSLLFKKNSSGLIHLSNNEKNFTSKQEKRETKKVPKNISLQDGEFKIPAR